MKRKILLIEDDKEIGRLIVQHLENNGYETSWEENGRDALYKISQKDFYQKIDLIIIDFLLPGMNGDKIIRFLKFNNKTKSIPIILITSRTIFDTIKKSELLNVDFLIFKPFTFDQLDEVIKKIFEKNGASVS